MNNLSEKFVSVNDTAELMELSTPVNLAMLPTMFRLTTIHHAQLDDKCTQCTASLHHDKAALKVKSGVTTTVRISVPHRTVGFWLKLIFENVRFFPLNLIICS